jgi:apolipoprotein N-acyltransferase
VSQTRRVAGRSGAIALGLITGAIYFAGTCYWVVEVMRQHGGLPLAVAMGVGVLMVAYLSIYVATFAGILGWAVQRLGARATWWAPVLWVATEWVRSEYGGFPWVTLGASQATVLPVVQAASVVGVTGLSVIVALVSTAAAAMAVLRGHASRWRALAVGVVVVATASWGTLRLSGGDWIQGEPLRVGLVQGNVAQEQKWDARFRDGIIGQYLALSREAIAKGAELVVWPEAATPFYFDAEGALAKPVRDLAASTSTPFLLGTDEYAPPRAGEDEQFFNSAVLVGADGRSKGSYKKMRLVPFGEFVPFSSLLFFVGPLVEAVSDFTAGTEPVVFDTGRGRVSVAICYESVYPGVSRQFVGRGSQLLATITNDAWFGRSSAPYQHFQQGAIRAVEQGRYIVRAANTGISGAVDPYGRVVAASALFEPASMTVDVRLINRRTIYSRTGDIAAGLSLVAALALVLQLGRLAARRRPNA